LYSISIGKEDLTRVVKELEDGIILRYSSSDGNNIVNIFNVPQKIKSYLNNNHSVSNDFSRSGGYDVNLNLLSVLLFNYISKLLNGTVYVPTARFITKIGIEPQYFTSFTMPGECMTYGTIITRLSEMDRPPTLNLGLREKHRELQEFVAFCLEKKEVKIEIPDNKQTIHVKIDGEERPIEDLGTGVEQLIIIGLASIGFPGKLVLIDEPELHFHPRAQKRMIQYLDSNIDANFVFATHSAAVLDAISADVLQIAHDGAKSIIRTISSNNEKYTAVRDLGHSPSELLQTRFAIWVEGPSDRVYVNSWIKKIDPKLVEGVDYTILFYGGKILSQHSFIDEDSELVKAVSLARAFAVVMDSDRKPDNPRIRDTKLRVEEEIKKQDGICWITEGREIENYIPVNIIEELKDSFKGVNVPLTKLEQVLDPEKGKKIDFAREVVTKKNDDWPLDLKKRVTELVEAIRAAR
jgi:ABC-type multidrug transport system ATPase subunit